MRYIFLIVLILNVSFYLKEINVCVMQVGLSGVEAMI